ncbi:hypothetical protein GGX14DRAFT_388816 [Mycena pura]|uniref:Uncharacterized protein n=1 Tax=Mycena pura TaxID=153505 RepID=A0AAD6YJD3_9AGAR|nr:hypothetical protein GGX14DRAFT_388816 [Mycena pura]
MTRGKALSDDLRGAILNMSRFLDIPEICHYTNCKKRTVEHILEDYHKKGTVMREHLRLEMRGAKRSMSAGDLRVCGAWFLVQSAEGFTKFLTGVVRHSPDVYLDELRELLEETRGSDPRRCLAVANRLCFEFGPPVMRYDNSVTPSDTAASGNTYLLGSCRPKVMQANVEDYKQDSSFGICGSRVLLVLPAATELLCLSSVAAGSSCRELGSRQYQGTCLPGYRHYLSSGTQHSQAIVC